MLAHADFGGVTSAFHLISYRGLDASCFVPQGALAQTLGHIINPASARGGPPIEPPTCVPTPVPRAPVVLDGLLRGDGLFDVFRPRIEIACRSVFSPTKWVRRQLSPEEFLRTFDVPAMLVDHFLANRHDRSLLLRSLPPLVVAGILRSMWGRVRGGLAGSNPQDEVGNQDASVLPMELEDNKVDASAVNSEARTGDKGDDGLQEREELTN